MFENSFIEGKKRGRSLLYPVNSFEGPFKGLLKVTWAS